MKKRKWYKKQPWRRIRNCKKMQTVRAVDFERLSNRIDNRLEFSGEYIVTLIFDEGLPTQERVMLHIDRDGRATINNLLNITAEQTAIYNSPISEGFTRQ